MEEATSSFSDAGNARCSRNRSIRSKTSGRSSTVWEASMPVESWRSSSGQRPSQLANESESRSTTLTQRKHPLWLDFDPSSRPYRCHRSCNQPNLGWTPQLLQRSQVLSPAVRLLSAAKSELPRTVAAQRQSVGPSDGSVQRQGRWEVVTCDRGSEPSTTPGVDRISAGHLLRHKRDMLSYKCFVKHIMHYLVEINLEPLP